MSFVDCPIPVDLLGQGEQRGRQAGRAESCTDQLKRLRQKPFLPSTHAKRASEREGSLDFESWREENTGLDK